MTFIRIKRIDGIKFYIKFTKEIQKKKKKEIGPSDFLDAAYGIYIYFISYNMNKNYYLNVSACKE